MLIAINFVFVDNRFMDKYAKLKEIISKSKHLVVFSGAGISVPSGIPDFRSANGIYSEKFERIYSPEQIISRSFFDSNPEEFYRFYKAKMMYLEAKANSAHTYFADLENKGKDVSIVTQNIDGLHQLAGSKKVYELHGSIYRNYCLNCGTFYNASYIKNCPTDLPLCPKCGGLIKPDVTLYEEQLNEDVIDKAINALRKADTCIVIGTSLIVYPANTFLRYFGGNHLIYINKSKTAYDDMAEIVFNEDCIDVINKIK